MSLSPTHCRTCPEASVLTINFGSPNGKRRIAVVPIVVPVKNAKNGPDDFKLAPEAEISVMFYVEGVVKANHAFAAEELDEQGIEAMLDDVVAALGK